MEDEESLETSALISKLTDTVKHQVNDLLSNGVVTTGIVVGSILLAGHKLLRVKELAVCASTDLIDYSGFKIDEHRSGDMLASASLAEEGVEGVVSTSDGLVTGHLAIRLDSVLQTVQLPASIADLDTGLSDMDGDTFTHDERC